MNSDYIYTPNIWPSVFSIILLIFLSIYSWRRRGMPGALPFAIGCLLTVPLGISLIMGYIASDLPTKIFWFKFHSIWQLPATTAITCFILEYTQPGRWLTRRNLILLSVVPLLVPLFVLTNDSHHLLWLGFTYDGSVIAINGPAGWTFIWYTFAWTFINIIVFTWLFVRSPQHRIPVVIMVFSQILVRVMYIFDSAKLDASLYYVPEFVIPFLAYAVALFTFRIFDPIPFARQTVIEQLRDGMLVLDSRGRVASLNPAAERILGIPTRRAVGVQVTELLPAYPDKLHDDSGRDEIDLKLGEETASRDYRLSISLLKDWRGLEVGRLLLLQDVTEEKQILARINEQQRALAISNEREWLARELHDSLGQVFAFVNSQGQAVRRLLARGDVSTADEYTARMVAVAREADVDIRESILGLRVSISGNDLFPALAEYLTRYEKNYGIHTVLSRPETLGRGTFEPQVEVQLLRILQEALTNARKHADARTVWVVFKIIDGCAQVTVQDDGKGFEQQELSGEIENRVGLRVMRERAVELGGNLAVCSGPGKGTLIIVTVPLCTFKENEIDPEREPYARTIGG